MTLKGELLELAEHGRVLVLLDACHSGATTLDGVRARPWTRTALRHGLAAANVTVLTSSSGQRGLAGSTTRGSTAPSPGRCWMR